MSISDQMIEIYDEAHRYFERFAGRIRPADAEDLASEVLVRVAPHIGGIDRPIAYARVAMKNIRYTHFSRRSRTPSRPCVEFAEYMAPVQAPESESDNAEKIDFADEFYADLDEKDRTAVLMQIDGATYRDIGKTLGCSAAAAGMRLMRIRKRASMEYAEAA